MPTRNAVIMFTDIKGFTDQSVYNDSKGPASDEKQVLVGFEAIYEF